MKNSSDLTETLDKLKLTPSDIIASLDVVSLHTRVSLKETIDLLTPSFSVPIVKLFSFVLSSTYFVCNGIVYEQVEGIPMGSSLSPIIADFFMEPFETKAVESAPLKPLIYKHFVDLVIWTRRAR